MLEPWVVGTPVSDSATGSLFDTGRGYPGATFGADGPTLVHGTVVELDPDRRDAALAALDRYEGHEYERVVIRTRSGAEVVTYAWIAPLIGCQPVTDGVWAD